MRQAESSITMGCEIVLTVYRRKFKKFEKNEEEVFRRISKCCMKCTVTLPRKARTSTQRSCDLCDASVQRKEKQKGTGNMFWINGK